MTSSLGKALGGLLAGSTIALLLGGCATAQDKAGAPAAGYSPGVGADGIAVQLVLNVTREGRLQVLSRDGKALTRCQFCTEEMQKQFGKDCKRAPAPPICASTAGTATLHSVDQFTVITSSGSPGCATLVMGGISYQVPPCW
jgi:hypothetical protein